MIIEEHPDDGAIEFIIHQSWLGDWLMCNRRGIWSADTRTGPSEATAIGTAMHAGFEAYLYGLDGEDCYDKLAEALDAEWQHPLFRNVKGLRYMSALQTSRACLEAMIEQVYPTLAPMVSLEHQFRHVVDEKEHSGLTLRLVIEGTIDADEGPDGRIWDWKTAGREYQQWEKDRWGPQQTIYTLAKAIELGRLDRELDFSYGIALKRKTNVKTQILHTSRGPKDWAWVIEVMWAAVNSYRTYAHDNQAPVNDQGWFCSETWCHWWSQCKGAERELPEIVRGYQR